MGGRHSLVQDLFLSHLYHYQQTKINSTNNAQILFVGDSALGYLVDAYLFSELANTKTLNLALTGIFGFAGSMNMMLDAIQKNQVHTVIVTHHPKTLKDKISYQGHFATTPLFTPFKYNLYEFFRYHLNGKTLLNITRQALGFSPSSTQIKAILEAPIIHDFVRQTNLETRSYVEKKSNEIWNPKEINPNKDLFLKEISRQCQRLGITCLYLHAPWLEGQCQHSQNYIQAANKMITQSGLHLVEEKPACTPIADAGDTVFHIRPELKQTYTRLYYETLRPFLNTKTNPKKTIPDKQNAL